MWNLMLFFVTKSETLNNLKTLFYANLFIFAKVSMPAMALNNLLIFHFLIFFKYANYVNLIMACSLSDSDYPRAIYTVTFNVNVSDVDDVTPVFTNLPSNTTINRALQAGMYK